MEAALAMAQEALHANEVPIGCVIINEETGEIVARGRNRTNETRNATLHAEFDALNQLWPKIISHDDHEFNLGDFFANHQLFVTVEPCIMCAAALRSIGLTKIYFGCLNDRFGGCGSVMAAHRDFIAKNVDPPLECVWLKEYRRECVELLRHFYLRENERAPIPKKKMNRTFKPVLDKDGAP